MVLGKDEKPRGRKFISFHKHFLARKDVCKRSLAMQNRIDELKGAHKWGPKEMAFVLSTLDADSDIPINLHEVGELASQTINHIPSISQRSSQ